MTGTCSSIGIASRWIQATNVVVCCMRGGEDGEKGKERQHVGDLDPNLCVQYFRNWARGISTLKFKFKF